jgi:uncharacterized protein YcbX
MAITSTLNEADQTITLAHPGKADLTFDPDKDAAPFLDWTRDLMPEGRAGSARIVRAQAAAMTDTDFPSVSVSNLSSLRALGQKLGQDLSPLRFRSNIWLDGLGPWEEFEWIGRRLRIGDATLEIRERTTRCLATTANPETGERDADTLGALEDGWGHRDFGIYGVVTSGGDIAVGDAVDLI